MNMSLLAVRTVCVLGYEYVVSHAHGACLRTIMCMYGRACACLLCTAHMWHEHRSFNRRLRLWKGGEKVGRTVTGCRVLCVCACVTMVLLLQQAPHPIRSVFLTVEPG